jgi:hypothetical protein
MDTCFVHDRCVFWSSACSASEHLDTLLAYDGGTVATTSKAATTKNRRGISSWRVHCFTPSLFFNAEAKP